MERKWKKIENELPQTDGRYLVYYADESYPQFNFPAVTSFWVRYKEFGYLNAAGKIVRDPDILKPTHWMELPEAPEAPVPEPIPQQSPSVAIADALVAIESAAERMEAASFDAIEAIKTAIADGATITFTVNAAPIGA